MVEHFERCPSPVSMMVLEQFSGAVSRVPVDATPVPHREASYNFVIASVWLDPAATDENIAWTRGAFAAMEPFLADNRYVNYGSADDIREDRARASYGPNYDRLVEVKNVYDPANLFRLNQNIKPTVS
jgi:hypothetical protein